MEKEKKQQKTDVKYTAPALEKGLDIIELLSKEPDGLRLKDIGGKLNKSVSEIFRMVSVLERRDYLSLDPTNDRYSLSLKLFEVAFDNMPVDSLARSAGATMEQLAIETGQPCYLAMAYKDKAMVIQQKDAPLDWLICARLGARFDLDACCPGKLMLAYQDTPCDKDEHFAQIRKQGYVRMPSPFLAGVEEIAFPIFDRLEQVTASLVINYISYPGSHQICDIQQAINKGQLAAIKISDKIKVS
ncbi:IclR family transcriptional regulator [Catenovulum agarivorans]|uniref:IclR family transcriptional regulator n=1 Tax=Catenovulum agarivorans TaxID=1172192 RepID=UPI0002D4873D|nr:IclR family transcriptional regulator [Catenovulum agarivorans]